MLVDLLKTFCSSRHTILDTTGGNAMMQVEDSKFYMWITK